MVRYLKPIEKCANCNKTIRVKKDDTNICYYLFGKMNYFCDFSCQSSWMYHFVGTHSEVGRDFKKMHKEKDGEQ